MSRTSRLLIPAVAITCILVAGFVVAMPRHSASANSPAVVAAANAPETTKPAATSTAAEQLVAPPGSILHTAKRGETMSTLVHAYMAQSSFVTVTEFREAIRKANGDFKGDYLRAGQQYVIPGMDSPITSEKAIEVPRTFEVRAIYLTGAMAGSDKGVNIVREWRKVGGNSVVFDIKDSDGSLSINFDSPLAPTGRRAPIWNLPKYVHFLHSQNMHAIARIAMFRDQLLVEHHPELAVKSRKTGQAWRENGKLVWTDPSHPEIQNYDIALALAAAKAGVDEIQFDYVRFPAEGDQKDASFYYQTKHPNWQRSDVIVDFLSRAYQQIHPTGALLSLDVFGVMAWQRPVDLSHTGQDIPRMAQYCDVLSPMIYPSHFYGMDGYKLPGDAPEHFISMSMDKFEKITQGTGVVIRPWLQAFAWRTKTYSPEYIRTQVATSHEKGGIGFLFWNARNDYSKPFVAMPEMEAQKAKFFTGDELPSGGSVKPAISQPGADTPQPAVVPASSKSST